MLFRHKIQVKFLDCFKCTLQMVPHHFLGLTCVLQHSTWMKEKQLVGSLDMKDYTITSPLVSQFLTLQRKILIILNWSNWMTFLTVVLQFQSGKIPCGWLTWSVAKTHLHTFFIVNIPLKPTLVNAVVNINTKIRSSTSPVVSYIISEWYTFKMILKHFDKLLAFLMQTLKCTGLKNEAIIMCSFSPGQLQTKLIGCHFW